MPTSATTTTTRFSSDVDYDEDDSHLTKEDYDDEDDNDEEKDDEEDDDEDDDDDDEDGILTYLLDKSLWKQHSIAILVALIASALSFVHLNPSNHYDSNVPLHDVYPYPAPSHVVGEGSYPTPSSNGMDVPTYHTVPTPKTRLRDTLVHHHESYRRTETLLFCPTSGLEEVGSTESSIQRIQRFLSWDIHGDRTFTPHWDKHLQLFQFNFPHVYQNLMGFLYLADDLQVDTYNASSLLESSTMSSQEEQFQCLQQAAHWAQLQGKSTVPMQAIGYQYPPLSSFYQHPLEEPPQHIPPHHVNAGLSVMNLLKEQKKQQQQPQDGTVDSEMEGEEDEDRKQQGYNLAADQHAASLSYTGFTAKFVNLDNRPLNLFWDGNYL